MAEKKPAPARSKKAKPNPESGKRNYEARRPTPTEAAKDEQIAYLISEVVYHKEQCRLVRIEYIETRSSHALEIGNLRDDHGNEVAALRDELARLRPEVSRLRESLSNLKANSEISAVMIVIGGIAVSAAGQFPLKLQVPLTFCGVVAVVCGVVFLSLAAKRSKPTLD